MTNKCTRWDSDLKDERYNRPTRRKMGVFCIWRGLQHISHLKADSWYAVHWLILLEYPISAGNWGKVSYVILKVKIFLACTAHLHTTRDMLVFSLSPKIDVKVSLGIKLFHVRWRNFKGSKTRTEFLRRPSRMFSKVESNTKSTRLVSWSHFARTRTLT